MNLILIGLLFAILDIKIYLGDIVLELPPDFIGHFLMLLGFLKLSEITTYFSNAFKISIPATAISVIYFILDFLGVFLAQPFTLFIVDTVMFVLFALTLLFLIKGIYHVEEEHDCYIGYDGLNILWRIFVAVYLAFIALTFISALAASIALILNFVILLTFWVMFLRTNKLYKEIFA